MKKLLSIITILAVTLLLFSCNSGNGEEESNGAEEPPVYYTITYHKGENTIGEPPVDPKKYKRIKDGYYDYIYDTFTVLDKGTLEHNEGWFFRGWNLRSQNGTSWEPNLATGSTTFEPGDQVSIKYARNLDFEPLFSPY